MQILSGLCGKLFIVKAKLKNENQKMIGWHVGCKRKGRREGAKFPQREFARDGSLKLQRSIATSRQRTGQDDRLAAAGVLTLRGGVTCLTP